MTEKYEKEKNFSEILRKAVEEVKDQEFLIKIPIGEEDEHESAKKHDRRTV